MITRFPGQQDDGDSDEDEDTKNIKSHYTETSSHYQITKILSSEQYTLGKNV
jgi:hypothetical protein